MLHNRGHVDHLGIAERVRRESGRRSGCTRQMRHLSNGRHIQSETSHIVALTGDALVTGDGIAGRTGPSLVNAAFTHVSSPDLSELLGLKPRRKSP